jgi:hypothetical protein
MPGQVLTVVCAWCNEVITPAPAGAAITHSICPPCFAWALAHRTVEVEGESASHGGELHLPQGYFGFGDAFKN